MSNWLGIAAEAEIPTTQAAIQHCGSYLRNWQVKDFEQLSVDPIYLAYMDCVERLFASYRSTTIERQHWIDICVDIGSIAGILFLLYLVLKAWSHAFRSP